ncbi:uncharacterized protein V2V93DRAFT_363474 [Kockiozyma suomiensis]|uniref:uncharacterized protein n=1 Tax=Kockiozyma suomiensis TaxID=1337062 RepID=UPI003342FAD5
MNAQTIALLAAPILLPRIIQYIKSWQRSKSLAKSRIQPLDKSEKLVCFIFLCIGFSLIFHAASLSISLKHSNPFIALGLPLNTPSSTIIASLKKKGQYTAEAEVLIQRLSTPHARVVYVSFGLDALDKCEWCSSLESYRIYVLSELLWPCISQLGIIVLAPGKLRSYAATGVVLCMVAVTYALFTAVSVNSMTDQKLWFTFLELQVQRDGFLALVYLVLVGVSYLVYSRRLLLSSDELIAEQRTQVTKIFEDVRRRMEGTLQTCRSANLVRAAVASDDILRRQSTKFSDEIVEEERIMLREAEIKNAIGQARSEVSGPVYERLVKEAGDYADAIIRVSKDSLRV